MRNVLIIDDHKLIFGGLAQELGDDLTLHYASMIDEALKLSDQFEFQSAIVDITLGDEDGFELADLLRNKVEYIFFLSMHKSPLYIKQAKDEGFNGYFLKDDNLDLIVEAISNPQKRKFWWSDEVEKLIGCNQENEYSFYDKLSPREQQVFRLLAEGQKYKEIAFNLKIKPSTASVHREKVMAKMDFKSQTDLVLQAIRLGIIKG